MTPRTHVRPCARPVPSYSLGTDTAGRRPHGSEDFEPFEGPCSLIAVCFLLLSLLFYIYLLYRFWRAWRGEELMV
jgi:hypothetical protein